MPSRVRRRRWPQVLSSLMVAMLFLASWWWELELIEQQPEPAAAADSAVLQTGEYDVRRVIDGDTLLLEHPRVRVRLQGIDTPETVKEDTPVQPWGREASAYTKRFVAQAQGRVHLELEGQQLDKYDRHLAFVWHQGRFLNEELVRQGLARAKTHYDYSDSLKQRLRMAQQEARQNRRGIWSRP